MMKLPHLFAFALLLLFVSPAMAQQCPIVSIEGPDTTEEKLVVLNGTTISSRSLTFHNPSLCKQAVLFSATKIHRSHSASLDHKPDGSGSLRPVGRTRWLDK